jgi:hypothetical protein
MQGRDNRERTGPTGLWHRIRDTPNGRAAIGMMAIGILLIVVAIILLVVVK